MRKLTLIVGIVAVIALAMAGAALAQDAGILGLRQPVAVTIRQTVPVSVVVPIPQEDGTSVDTTIPLTVGVNLEVTIDGQDVVSVKAGEGEPASVAAEVLATEATAADGQLVDAAGYPYEVNSRNDIVIIQSRLRKLIGDNVEVIGELQNNGNEPSKYIQLHVMFYDADNNLLSIGLGYSTAEDLEPGGTSGFRVMTELDFAQVASYTIEIK